MEKDRLVIMAENQEFNEFRVDVLPNADLVAGDRYYLNVGADKHKVYIVSDQNKLITDSGSEFIEKDTLAELKSISEKEVWTLKEGIFKGVKLNGYYSKGDIPSPIEYYITDEDVSNNDGDVIVITVSLNNTIKLKHDFKGFINVIYFGAIIDQNTDNTPIIQKALNSLSTKGGIIEIPVGAYFYIDKLKFPIKVNLKFFKTDDRSRPSLLTSATNEQVEFMANANTGGIVNEKQMSASFHPGHVIDVRDDVDGDDAHLGTGQTRENPARASYNIRRQGMNKFRIVYQHYKDRTLSIANGTTFQPWRTEITLLGITQSSFTNTINVGDLIKGETSKGYGIIKSIDVNSVVVILEGYKFNNGEKVIVNNETSINTISSQPNPLYNGPLQTLSVDDINGNWGFGTAPDESRSLLTIAGELTLAPTRQSGQYIPKAEPNPIMSWIPTVVGSIYNALQGLSIKMDLTKADASRRLTLHKRASLDAIGHVGAVRAYLSFTTTALIGTSSFNITSIVKNGVGDYTINFLVPFTRADFTVSLSIGNPMEIPYVYLKTINSVRIRIATTGTSTLIDPTSLIGVICVGGDI